MPATATADPMPPKSDMGVLNTMQEATMMTTRLRVLATEWVTGERRSRARKEASL